MEVLRFDHQIDIFITNLQKPTISKVIRAIDILEQLGHTIGMPHSKKLLPNLFELRIHGDQEVRIFYTFHKQKAILLSGFVKKTQNTPTSELMKASKLLTKLSTS